MFFEIASVGFMHAISSYWGRLLFCSSLDCLSAHLLWKGEEYWEGRHVLPCSKLLPYFILHF